MQAGKLRHNIVIERPAETQDSEYNATKKHFIPFWKCWASIEPTADKEVGYANTTIAQSTHKVTIRGGATAASVNEKMRVNFKGRIFNIVGLNNFQERNIYIVLMCVETAVAAA